VLFLIIAKHWNFISGMGLSPFALLD